MYDGVTLVNGLCDRCDHREENYSKLAYEIVGPGIIENNGWVGGLTPEKVKKWRSSLDEAYAQLVKPCVSIMGDCENIVLCESCLRKILDEFNKK
jgi:hypothetical protein